MLQTKFANRLDLYTFMEQKLYSAVISDIMDDLKLTGRAMRPNIRPIHPDHVFAGRARTMLWMDIFEVYEHPYKVEIEAVDALEPGDIVTQTTNGSQRIVPWGCLMSTSAMARGARGAVIDGFVRDVKQIVKMGFPLFATGMCPLDSKGRGYMVRYDCPIECGGVQMNTGDLIFADYDGVVVVPQEAEEEVVARALEKVEKENLSLQDLREGQYLKDVYPRYGIL